MKRCLCLWLPHWPIQRIVAKQSELKRKHVALFRRDPRRGQLVAAASPLALRDGIAVGMPISEAKSLLQNISGKRQFCSQPAPPSTPQYALSSGAHPRTQHKRLAQHANLNEQGGLDSRDSDNEPLTQPAKHPFYILEHDPLADQQALEALADSLHEFSPIVGVEPSDEPDTLFLDMTGLGHLFGDEHRLIAQVVEHCQQQGYLVRVGTAETVGLAWGRAHFGSPPNSLQSETPFEALPVAALRLPIEMEETLGQLGIQQIGQLLSIPRADLMARFGDTPYRRIDQATGVINEPIVARQQPIQYQAEQYIEFPTQDRETIEVILTRLMQGICAQMRANQHGALQWFVKMNCVDHPAICFTVNLFQPTATTEHVMQLTQMQLDTALLPHTRKRKKRTPQKPRAKKSTPRVYTTIQIQEISVSVTSCVLLAERQRQLFDENPRLDKQALAHLINRLTSRLGQANVVYPSLQTGAQPEYSVRFRPLVDPRRRKARKTVKTRQRSHVMARPLRLLHPPRLLEAPEPRQPTASPNAHPLVKRPLVKRPLVKRPLIERPLIERPPAILSYEGIRHLVARAWGPERIETGWWRGPTTRRDYWRVETRTGQQLWVFFELRKKRWFLHGKF